MSQGAAASVPIPSAIRTSGIERPVSRGGEWFALTPADVRIFKRRKFM
jgi:hypothetical protein